MEARTGDGIDTADTGRERPALEAAELPAGSMIAGKYRIERTLGAGGMGIVVVATAVESGELVAIKVLRAEALKKKDVVARFEREARAVAKMGGDHVVRIVDFGSLESGEQYIAMEYLEGEDLARLLKNRGPLPLAEAVDYVAQACEALAEVHAAGIVHRDLKPGNLFLTRTAAGEPRIKLLDFGIAKTVDAGQGEGEVTLTTTESFLGSPVYMSPEQMVTPKKVDPRTDVWALGVTLYRLLSRKVPFDGETPMEICGMIMSGARPNSLRDLGIDVPGDLDRAVLKCLSREPADRFRNVAELAEALAPFGTPEAVASAARARKRLTGVESAWATLSSPMLPRVRVSPDDIETLAAGTLSTIARRSGTSPSTSGRRIAFGVAAVAIAAGAFFAFRATRSATPPAADAASASTAVPAAVPPPAETAAPPIASAPPAAPDQAPSTEPAASAPKGGAKRGGKSRADASAAPAASAPPAPPTSSALPGGVFGGRPF